MRVTHVGVCHTDLHAVEGMAAGAPPLVPGHEFTGVVTEVGADVTRFQVGDAVAVGNIVDWCGKCDDCLAHRQPYCVEFPATTYGGRDLRDGTPTQGAYSTEYVVRDSFVYALPEGLDPAAVAPLMCAGVTVWSPLRRAGVGPGQRVGVVGLGGLGHLAVRFAVALGAEVTVFTTSAQGAGSPRAGRLRRRRLDRRRGDGRGGRPARRRRRHRLRGTRRLAYLRTLRLDGTLVVLGLPERYSVEALSLLGRRMTVSGSAGTAETQEMLDFCGEHGLTADVEVLPMDQVNTAFERLARGDVRWRFVLDVTA